MSVFDAVVLAGGKGARLGGVDKPSIDIAGKSMLERVLDACSGARATAIVGSRRPTSRPVTWTLEAPRDGGPLAGLGAGLAALPADTQRVVVLAADLPYMTADAIARLLVCLPGHDAAIFVDDDGRAQPLAGAYLASALSASLRACGELRNRPAMRILDNLRTVSVADEDGVTRDCDTVAQVETARRTLGRTQMLDDWVAAVKDELDVAVDVDVTRVLDIARVAAHNVERPAAPLTTFLLGYAAGQGGGDDMYQRLTALAERWPQRQA